MLVVTEDLKSQLALGNEAVQIQVTADYNFHSEESFKLNYWTKVVGVLSCTQPEMLVGVTVGSLKDWWSAAVTRRSLPGLGKVLYTSLNMDLEHPGGEAGHQIPPVFRYQGETPKNFFPSVPTGPMPSPTSGIVGKAASVMKSVARSLWRLVGEDEGGEPVSELAEDEIIFHKASVLRYSKKILASLGSGSVLVTEDRIRELIGKPEEGRSPFVKLTSHQLTTVVVTALVEQLKAVPFVVDQHNCLKLPADYPSEVTEVSEAEKAVLMHEIALEKLAGEERSLTGKWTEATVRLQEHLRTGRQPLALAALKERKLIEKRIEDIQIFKLKLEESASMAHTAILHQTVISAIAISSAATKTAFSKTAVDDVSELMEAVDGMQRRIQEVNDALAPSDELTDESVLDEYNQLLLASIPDVPNAPLPSIPEVFEETSTPPELPATRAPQLAEEL